VFWHILYRMVFWEMAKVFTLSLIGITGILLMAGIVAEASQQGLSPGQVVEIIPLLIPSTLPYTIPATTLFATCVVYGRLAADNEILALKAAGVNVLKVVYPGVFLGLLMSCATMGLYYRLIPYTHGLMRSMFLDEVEESLYAVLRRDKAINQPRLNYAMWVREVQGKKLINALFKKRDEKTGQYEVIAWAREAELQVNLNTRQLVVHMRSGSVYSPDGGADGVFDDRMEYVDLPPGFGVGAPKRARDLTWKEIGERRREVIRLSEKLETDLALEASKSLSNEPPIDLAKHAGELRDQMRFARLELYSLDAEVHMRPAIAFGCLCFVLAGCPIAIWFSKSDYLSAFITCFLPIVFVYYPLLLCGTNLAKEGKPMPELCIWGADILMVTVSLFLFRRLLKN
jgi:lipopolysaccharide export system permease protein